MLGNDIYNNQGNIIVQQAVAKLGEDDVQQPVAQINEEVFFSVPWGITCISYRSARMLTVLCFISKRQWKMVGAVLSCLISLTSICSKR